MSMNGPLPGSGGSVVFKYLSGSKSFSNLAVPHSGIMLLLIISYKLWSHGVPAHEQLWHKDSAVWNMQFTISRAAESRSLPIPWILSQSFAYSQKFRQLYTWNHNCCIPIHSNAVFGIYENSLLASLPYFNPRHGLLMAETDLLSVWQAGEYNPCRPMLHSRAPTDFVL